MFEVLLLLGSFLLCCFFDLSLQLCCCFGFSLLLRGFFGFLRFLLELLLLETSPLLSIGRREEEASDRLAVEAAASEALLCLFLSFCSRFLADLSSDVSEATILPIFIGLSS